MGVAVGLSLLSCIRSVQMIAVSERLGPVLLSPYLYILTMTNLRSRLVDKYRNCWPTYRWRSLTCTLQWNHHTLFNWRHTSSYLCYCAKYVQKKATDVSLWTRNPTVLCSISRWGAPQHCSRFTKSAIMSAHWHQLYLVNYFIKRTNCKNTA